MATAGGERIRSLDIIRGIAVMGIFSVNVVGMAMIESAYFYPPDYGFGSLGDKIMWAANFIVVDGKFRSLFSMLFGASLVLIVERAVASGKPGWKVHYPRMVVLLMFGLAHFYLLWWGDILANYALVGMVAFAFWRLRAKWQVMIGCVALAIMYLPPLYFGTLQVQEMEAMRSPGASAEDRAAYERRIAPPTAADLAEDQRSHLTIPAHVAEMTGEERVLEPFQSMFGYGLETLGLMLLGMAGYKSGYLTGAWSRRSYMKMALGFGGASLAYFAVGAWRILATDFDPLVWATWNQIWSGPLHPVGAIGYSAVIILLLAGRPTALSERIAAVGRAAFSNYLGATIFGTLVFFGFAGGLYGEVSRGQAWLFAPLLWALMLLWSKPWLDRFRYGPFEWAWRSLSRGRWEPMRKASEAVPAAA